jgi:hypothetical protein
VSYEQIWGYTKIVRNSFESFRLFTIAIAFVGVHGVGGLAYAISREQNELEAQYSMPQTKKMPDAELMALVKTFSEDVGPDGEAAWQKLQAYPRNELINHVIARRDTLPSDDHTRYQFAFLLCNLGYKYHFNVKQIESALVSQSGRPSNDADTAAIMLGRLLRRGHKELLNVLFSAAPSSDGSLSEALSDVLFDQLRNNTSNFLIELRDEPRAIRFRVYQLVNDGPVSRKDLQHLKAKLQLLSRSSGIAEVAKEALASPIFKP